MYEVKLN